MLLRRWHGSLQRLSSLHRWHPHIESRCSSSNSCTARAYPRSRPATARRGLETTLRRGGYRHRRTAAHSTIRTFGSHGRAPPSSSSTSTQTHTIPTDNRCAHASSRRGSGSRDSPASAAVRSLELRSLPQDCATIRSCRPALHYKLFFAYAVAHTLACVGALPRERAARERLAAFGFRDIFQTSLRVARAHRRSHSPLGPPGLHAAGCCPLSSLLSAAPPTPTSGCCKQLCADLVRGLHSFQRLLSRRFRRYTRRAERTSPHSRSSRVLVWPCNRTPTSSTHCRRLVRHGRRPRFFARRTDPRLGFDTLETGGADEDDAAPGCAASNSAVTVAHRCAADLVGAPIAVNWPRASRPSPTLSIEAALRSLEPPLLLRSLVPPPRATRRLAISRTHPDIDVIFRVRLHPARRTTSLTLPNLCDSTS